MNSTPTNPPTPLSVGAEQGETPTPRTDAIFKAYTPENPKPYFHNAIALSRTLERELSQKERELNEAKAERDAIRLNLESAKEANMPLRLQWEVAIIERDDLRTRLAQVEAERDSLRAQQAEAIRRWNIALDENAQLKTALQSAHSELEGLKGERAQLERTLLTARDRLERYRQRTPEDISSDLHALNQIDEAVVNLRAAMGPKSAAAREEDR